MQTLGRKVVVKSATLHDRLITERARPSPDTMANDEKADHPHANVDQKQVSEVQFREE
jgi:hypothetical protein